VFPNNRIVFFVFNSFRMQTATLSYRITISRTSCTFNVYNITFTITSHNRVPYSKISVTTPAATVCPPSRIAKRNSVSIAIGIINSIDNSMLSPGMTISVPAGNAATPVTSVVRK